MTTIKEMAIEESHLCVPHNYTSPLANAIREAILESYTRGANAVLEEIEKALDLGEPPYLISTEQAFYRAERLIKELKE